MTEKDLFPEIDYQILVFLRIDKLKSHAIKEPRVIIIQSGPKRHTGLQRDFSPVGRNFTSRFPTLPPQFFTPFLLSRSAPCCANLPTFLLPNGSHFNAFIGSSLGCILKTCPIHFHLLFLTSLRSAHTKGLVAGTLLLQRLVPCSVDMMRLVAGTSPLKGLHSGTC